MLYMSPEGRNNPEVKSMAKKALQNSSLVFYSKPVDQDPRDKFLDRNDPNRVHTVEQSRSIDADIHDLLKNLGLDHYTLLVGSPEARLGRAYQAVNSTLGQSRAA
jgi:hypothetical protein